MINNFGFYYYELFDNTVIVKIFAQIEFDRNNCAKSERRCWEPLLLPESF